MKTVSYGAWKIAVDVEKTKQYYSDYVINDTQANKNFAKYCSSLSKEERAFFDDFGITPECCEIEHIGTSKKKEIPCGGYYYICGSYIEHPQEILITVDELAENDFEDDRNSNTINIGIFEFDFQCKDFIFSLIPDDMPEGFLCVKFWCEDMKWLLDEKPETVMYEPPKFWEIGKIIKERRQIKAEQKEWRVVETEGFTKMFCELGIEYSELNSKEIKRQEKLWVDSFTPTGADRKDVNANCLSNRKYSTYLWHLFSFEYLNSEETPEKRYAEQDKNECILISSGGNKLGFLLKNASGLSADLLNEFTDVVIFSSDMSWTYCKTHEEELGPYFFSHDSTKGN